MDKEQRLLRKIKEAEGIISDMHKIVSIGSHPTMTASEIISAVRALLRDSKRDQIRVNLYFNDETMHTLWVGDSECHRSWKCTPDDIGGHYAGRIYKITRGEE
jgi:hypothetical protein